MATALALLQQTANQLKQEGKQPNLTLFKARLTGQLSVPELFRAYQQWRQLTEQVIDDNSIEEQASSLPVDNPASLTSQLNRIEQKLDRLLALLEQQHVSG
ncbi:hypothetical protein ACO1PK_11155 [Alishewanella sp. d11]|uniref:hypothetical protein n=1 Tax=Alishewanella sp. d11 TaxID=3414030 RepID=UPI003BF8C109